MNQPKFIAPVVYIAIMILSCFSNLQAQSTQQGSVSITPASIDAKVKSGSSYTQTFTIRNGTGVRLRFRCSVEDMGYDENNVRLTGRPGTLPRSASLWTQFTPAEVVIEPNSSASVKAVITVPQAVSGSYSTVPVFEGMPADISVPNASQTNTATASVGIKFRGLMLFTTEEGAEYNIEIMNGRILPPTASSELELNLGLRNRGTAHARVRGAFAILDSNGKLIGRGNIEEKRYLPTQADSIKGKWSGELPSGTYISVITLSYNRVGLEPFSLVYELPFTVK